MEQIHISNDDVNVAFTAGENCTSHICAAIHSIIDHSSPQLTYNIFIFNNGLSTDSQKQILCLADNKHPIFLIDVANKTTDSNTHFLTTGLPSTVERILYLNTSIIARDDVARLYKLDLSFNIAAACQDYTNCNIFNTGVLLLDLKKARQYKKDYFSDIAEEKIFLNDLINKVFKNQTLHLSSDWNTQISLPCPLDLETIKIFNYCGSNKTWTYSDFFSTYIQPEPANNSDKISIIVPNYNAEKYISHCLDALINQTYTNIEIICIDDGSNDNSPTIIQGYADRDNRIKFFRQSHAGPAIARNLGLSNATGSYIMFCDSDDWYQPNMCEVMLNSIKENNVDFAICDINHFEETVNKERLETCIKNRKVKTYGKQYLDNNSKKEIYVLIWNKIFRKSLIDKYDICFPNCYESEDCAFIYQYLAVSNLAYGVKQKLHNYLIRNDSIMGKKNHSNNCHNFLDRIICLGFVAKQLQKNSLLEQSSFFISIVSENFHWILSHLNYEQKKTTMKTFQKEVLSHIPAFMLSGNPMLELCQKGKFNKALRLCCGYNKISFCNITLLKIKYKENKKQVYILGLPIFKKKKTETSKKYYLLGLKIWSHKNSLHKYIKQKFQDYKHELQIELRHTTNSLQNKIYGYCEPIQKIVSLSSGRYNNISEIKFIKRFYSKYYPQDPAIPNLLRGLDEKSAGTIIDLIKKIEKLLFWDCRQVDFYSDEEKRARIELTKNFYSQILQVSPSVFAYHKYFLPKNHFEAGIFYNKHYITSLQNKEKIKNLSIIDVGAYIGDSALILQEFEPRKIYCFEANPENRNFISETIRLNHLSNLEIVPLALGDKEGSIDITIADSCSSCVANSQLPCVSVPMTTLDNYVAENHIDDIGLIKVDIEGFEQFFLRGAIETIKKQKPALLLSIYHNWEDFSQIKPLIESLNLGYKFKVIKPIDCSIITETLLIAEVY